MLEKHKSLSNTLLECCFNCPFFWRIPHISFYHFLLTKSKGTTSEHSVRRSVRLTTYDHSVRRSVRLFVCPLCEFFALFALFISICLIFGTDSEKLHIEFEFLCYLYKLEKHFMFALYFYVKAYIGLIFGFKLYDKTSLKFRSSWGMFDKVLIIKKITIAWKLKLSILSSVVHKTVDYLLGIQLQI